MADSTTSPTPSRATLGLTGLTSNAMALIAPGAFLWLTYSLQTAYGAPIAGCAMWFGILVALLLCLATAVAYAELSKLYPGAGSSYFFAEQAFLSKRQAFKWARIAKFMVGWASHLYYWVYPGVMVGVTALVVGYMAGQIWPNTFSPGIPSPLFMIVFCVVFAFGVAYIAFRGVGGTTSVNAAINVIQIVALLVFSVMAIRYRMVHPQGSTALTIDSNSGMATQWMVPVNNADGTPKIEIVKDAHGVPTSQPVMVAGTLDYTASKDPSTVAGADGADFTPVQDPRHPDDPKALVPGFQLHSSPASVVAPHGMSLIFVQACVAILILVGFESVTAMGEEAKNAKRDIPRAVLLSLIIQGGFCYAIEYFASNYFLNSAYPSTTAVGSSAPIGDMMQIVGMHFFGSANAGWWFMMVQATTVFLALVGTTLSCLSTGARVTYAMGRDEEVPNHFGLLHGKKATPHRAIWTLAIISAGIGIFAVLFNFCGPVAQADTAIQALKDKHSIWYSFGLFSNATASGIPQGMLIVTLVSNFGTFLLYMMTCIVAIVAFREHHMFNGIKHMVVPIFGLLANLACMAFYVVGPKYVNGMSWKEPYCALAVVAAWGIYGLIYFLGRSKKIGRPVLISTPATVTSAS